MKRVFRLEKIFIAQYLKQTMEYKADFFVGVFGVLLNQGLNLVFLKIIFSQIPKLDGWSLQQIIFIYGFALIPKGLDHLFFDNLWAVGQRLVRKGEFDKYLTRPVNPLFHVLVETFQVDAFGELLVGVILLVMTTGTVHWTWLKLLLFILSIPFATSIYTSLKIGTSAMAFWMKKSGAISYLFYMFNDFARYPVSIFNNVVRWIISFIIPFAFTAFYPASYFLTDKNIVFNLGGLVVISIVFLFISISIWNKGITAYESAGKGKM